MEVKLTSYYTLSMSGKDIPGAHSLILQYMQLTINAVWDERERAQKGCKCSIPRTI